MKKRTISLLLVVLAFCMLFGVGFASWVISNSAQNTAQGQITVDTVTDNRVKVNYTWKDSKSAIIFGYDPDYVAQSTDWLTNADTTKAQNMSVTLQVHVTDDAGTACDASTVEATLAYAEGLSFGSYIVAPEAKKYTLSKTATGEYELTLTFTWGTAFDSKNPIKYYNGLEGGIAGFTAVGADQSTSVDNGDVAFTNLKAVELLGNATAFTLTINVAK